MDVYEVVNQARDAMAVRRVFGEPHEVDGVTIIPAANVRGGAGGGFGGQQTGEHGSGGGYGLSVTPAGAYVVKGGDVEWKPALDLNRAIIGGQIVVAIALLVLRSVARTAARPA